MKNDCQNELIYEIDIYAHKYRYCTNWACKLISKELIIDSDLKNYNFALYELFNIDVHSSNISVNVGKPDKLSPSGLEKIENILRNLGRKAGVERYVNNSSREWLFLENDDGIYQVVMKLIENVLQCPRCQDSIYGLKDFMEHSCVILYNTKPQYDFDGIVLSTGLLHYEWTRESLSLI